LSAGHSNLPMWKWSPPLQDMSAATYRMSDMSQNVDANQKSLRRKDSGTTSGEVSVCRRRLQCQDRQEGHRVSRQGMPDEGSGVSIAKVNFFVNKHLSVIWRWSQISNQIFNEDSRSKAALRQPFSACVYCIHLRFQSNYLDWLKPR